MTIVARRLFCCRSAASSGETPLDLSRDCPLDFFQTWRRWRHRHASEAPLACLALHPIVARSGQPSHIVDFAMQVAEEVGVEESSMGRHGEYSLVLLACSREKITMDGMRMVPPSWASFVPSHPQGPAPDQATLVLGPMLSLWRRNPSPDPYGARLPLVLWPTAL